MPKVVKEARTPHQLWDNMCNFGKECKALRLTTFRNSLYQLRLRNYSDYELWSIAGFISGWKTWQLWRVKTWKKLKSSLFFSSILEKTSPKSDRGWPSIQMPVFKQPWRPLDQNVIAAEIAQRNSHDGRRRGPPQNQLWGKQTWIVPGFLPVRKSRGETAEKGKPMQELRKLNPGNQICVVLWILFSGNSWRSFTFVPSLVSEFISCYDL